MPKRIQIDVQTGKRTEHDWTPPPAQPKPPRKPSALETLRAEFDALKAALVEKGVV